jgi:hypothetical protein
MRYADVADEREPMPGYDFAFAPCRPHDPEYRQACSDLHLQWLKGWAPQVGYWPQ